MIRAAFAVACGALAAAMASTPAAAQGLRAGAAKIEITPAASELTGTDTIRDPLFVRAIVVDDGKTCAVLVGVDQAGLSNEIVGEARRSAAKKTGCPEENYLISATHTHSGSAAAGGLGGAPGAAKIRDGIIAAITAAHAKLAPASLGYDTASVDLNTNRDSFDQGKWTQAPNAAGASDKTLTVLDFIGSDGVPIGVFMTYAMHPIDFFMTGVISADFPGEASRFVEGTYGQGAVAIFAQGASGDQNPRMLELPFLASLRTGQGVLGQRAGDSSLPIPPTAPNGVVLNMRTATLAPVPQRDLPAYRRELARNGQWVSAMGTLIGETVVDLIRTHTTNTQSSPAIWSGRETVLCQGRERLDLANPARENVDPGYRDAPDVPITVGLVRLGDVALVWVNGEVYSDIGQRLKRESPLARTALVTLANGTAGSGYIYSDSAANNLTFQVIGSKLKPGCAESGIVRAGLALIEKSRRP